MATAPFLLADAQRCADARLLVFDLLHVEFVDCSQPKCVGQVATGGFQSTIDLIRVDEAETVSESAYLEAGWFVKEKHVINGIEVDATEIRVGVALELQLDCAHAAREQIHAFDTAPLQRVVH